MSRKADAPTSIRLDGKREKTRGAARRSTFAGSRLSLHSVLFANSSHGADERSASSARRLVGHGPRFSDKMSRSTNDLQASSAVSATAAAGSGAEEPAPTAGDRSSTRECPLCFVRQPLVAFPRLSCCSHRSCYTCLLQYLTLEILESRVTISCPECNELIHPGDIHRLLTDMRSPFLVEKYEEFTLRRCLMSDPDTRWCPAPDCTFAVIATACAACPEIRCQRPGCGLSFCYHCKMVWHANKTCDEARAERGSFGASPLHGDGTIRPSDVKACPRCRTYIVKMNDGSCNHMVCAICGAEFCWLCLKEISDLHYLSPSGCTFWGKKPWSRKKKLMWQLGTLIGAPVGIALIAGLAVPAIVFGVPVFVGRKVYQRMGERGSKTRRRLVTAGSVVGSLLISPVLATMAVGVGVPILLAYVYGVVPLSLCRNGNCGVSPSSSEMRLNVLAEEEIISMTADGQEKSALLRDQDRLLDGTSTVTGASIHSGSSLGVLSATSGPGGGGAHHRLQVQAELCRRRPSIESGATSIGGERINYEEASTKAMAGSTYYDDKSVYTVESQQEAVSYIDTDAASTKALSGSVMETKSICGGVSAGGGADSASLRPLTGSIGPSDCVSVRSHAVADTHHHHHSPGPLLEEDASDGDDQLSAMPSTSRQRRTRTMSAASAGAAPADVVDVIYAEGSERAAKTSDHSDGRFVSARARSTRYVRHHSHHGSLMTDDGDGEFLLLSPDTIRQLNPRLALGGGDGTRKARSVSLLLDSSPSDLWQLLSDGGASLAEPWTARERFRTAGVAAFPNAKVAKRASSASYVSLPDDAPPKRSSSRLHLPKFSGFRRFRDNR